MYLGARTVSAMRETLVRGITTVRDLGGLEAGFVRAQEGGVLVGPRLQTSVVIIQAANGITDNLPGMGGTTSPQGLSSPARPAHAHQRRDGGHRRRGAQCRSDGSPAMRPVDRACSAR
jgi:imidazolonepropionase-like amidohydrolase